jgi:hypothetical protein
MKPKYEIDQKVYYKGNEYKIIGLKRISTEDPDFIYFLIGLDVKIYPNPWIDERELSLTPPDERRYYILYRSADGLQKMRRCNKSEDNLRIHILTNYSLKPKMSRDYSFIREEITDDGKTVVYVYEEV